MADISDIVNGVTDGWRKYYTPEEYEAFKKSEKEMQDRYNAPLPKVTVTTYDPKSAPPEEGVDIPERAGFRASMGHTAPHFEIPTGLRGVLDSAGLEADVLDDKFRAAKKAFDTTADKVVSAHLNKKTREAELNSPAFDTTIPELAPFVKGKKGARLGVTGRYDLSPSLKEGIRTREGEYGNVANRIEALLNEKRQKFALTPAEDLFLNYVADPDFKISRNEYMSDNEEFNELKNARDEARGNARAASKRYKIIKEEVERLRRRWLAEHKDRTLKIEYGTNAIGLRVSGGGKSVGYILKYVPSPDPEENGRVYLRGYLAVPNGKDTGNWLTDHSPKGLTPYHSIGKGYPIDGEGGATQALINWINGALGNTGEMTNSNNGAREFMQAIADNKAIEHLVGKSAEEFVNSLAEKNDTHPDFSRWLKVFDNMGLSVDRNTNIMYKKGEEPEGFVPYEFQSKETKSKLKKERIAAQAEKIKKQAEKGNSPNAYVSKDGVAVKVLKPENKTRVQSRYGTTEYNLNTGNKRQVQKRSDQLNDPGNKEKNKAAEAAQYKRYTEPKKETKLSDFDIFNFYARGR